MTDPPGSPSAELAGRIKLEARRLGFDLVGIAPAVVPPGLGHYREWLEQGREAGMAYLRDRLEARGHPRSVLPGVRSIIVVGMIYGRADHTPLGASEGKVARYARGADYHDVLWRKLEALLAWLRVDHPDLSGRATSDTAPILERDFARLAGLGWVGKNTCLIDRRAGSFTVLGSLLVDLDLEPDAPFESNHCGTCTRCLDACPTDAFDGPYQLDARRCLSYWTIEHRGPIPEEMAGRLDGWVFGCDICQDVCPWNRKAPPGSEPLMEPRPEFSNPDLIEWLASDPLEFARGIKGTALKRSKRSGLLRNAALILGTRQVLAAVPVLIDRLNDLDPVIRGASAWALRRIGENDEDPAVQDLVRRALASVSGDDPQTLV